MGLNDRDYARYRPVNGIHRRGGSEWEVWKRLIVANVVVFVLQIFITRPATEADFIDSPFYADDEIMWEMEDLQYQMDALHDSRSSESNIAESDSSDSTETSESATSELSDEERKAKARELAEKRRELNRMQMMRHMPNVSVVQEYMELDCQKIKQGQIWRLITYGFCHDRMWIFHLGFNMLLLYWCGQRLEQRYGSHEFAVLYFAGLFFAGLFYVAVDLYTGVGLPVVGASGAVWTLIVIYGLLFPYERINVYCLFPVEVRVLILVYFIFDLHPVLLMLSGDSYHDGVAHAAHVGGAVWGFMYWYNNWKLLPLVQQIGDYFAPKEHHSSSGTNSRSNKSDRGSGNLKVHRENQESNDDANLDEILEKISRDGRDSLTDDELIALENASRKMREDRQSD